MPAHPVGHIKPNPPIAGHHLRAEGRPEFCEHGRIEGGRGGYGLPCCPTWNQPVMGHTRCECGAVWRARSATSGKAFHREHKAEIRAARSS